VRRSSLPWKAAGVWLALLALGAPRVARADSPPPAPPDGPLGAYLGRPQPAYRWTVKSDEQVGEVTVLRLELVSQTWRGRPWTHRLNVVLPRPAEGDRARPGDAILAISGSGGEEETLGLVQTLATRLGVPVAVLHDVPNQPLLPDESPDGRGLREDALIAQTFADYMKTGDVDAPILLPMTRAAVAAMDALGELSDQRARAGAWPYGRLERFVTTGASKRGWTTWLTAVAAPQRVIGIAPIVYDNLNVAAQLKRHFEVWGHPSPMIHDYTERGLLQLLASPRGKELMAIVDPWSYRDRLALPKMALMGTNDTYWPVDALQLYRGDLPGELFCHYVPNAGHTAGLSILDAVAGFFDHVTHRTPPLPTLALTVAPRRGATVSIGEGAARGRVLAARVWAARVDGKDFTKATWEPADAQADGAGWTADLPARCKAPGNGSVALFGEVELSSSDGGRFRLDTPVQVWELGAASN
jgi:PhoPQ-activated pathogenicity-related protein